MMMISLLVIWCKLKSCYVWVEHNGKEPRSVTQNSQNISTLYLARYDWHVRTRPCLLLVMRETTSQDIYELQALRNGPSLPGITIILWNNYLNSGKINKCLRCHLSTEMTDSLGQTNTGHTGRPWGQLWSSARPSVGQTVTQQPHIDRQGTTSKELDTGHSRP